MGVPGLESYNGREVKPPLPLRVSEVRFQVRITREAPGHRGRGTVIK